MAQGSEFRVNTYTTNNQNQAAVAMDADGDFVVTWTSTNQAFATSNPDVYGQRFNAAGVAQGSEFRINTTTVSTQQRSTVGMDAAGNFVVAWEGYTGTNNDIYAQRYAADGQARGVNFLVNSYTTNAQSEASLAVDADGDFTIVWTSVGSVPNGGTIVKRYSAGGSVVDTDFRVDSTGGGSWASVAVDTDGDFVVAYNSGDDVYAQRFRALATPPVLTIGSEVTSIAENTSTATRRRLATVTITGDSPSAHTVTLTGADAGVFEIVDDVLYLKAGTALDFESKTSYSVTITVDNPTVGGSPDASASFTLNITDVPDATFAILDDGDAGFSTTGLWSNFGSLGRGSDVKYLSANAAAGTAAWSFAGLQPGRYRVSATWPGGDASVRASNAPFTIRATGGGPVLASAAIDQRANPNDFSDSGSAWEDLGTVTVTGSTLRVELTNVGADSYVIADAIRIERIADVPSAPEIAVMQGTTGVNDGGAFDFGDTSVGTAVTKTFTIHNVGSTDLVLQPATLPAGYSIVGANFAGNQIVAAGASTTLTVRLDAASAGAYNGTLSFATNDSDEAPFDIVLSGDVFAPAEVPVVAVIDNGDAGYSTTGTWSNWTSGGRDGDLQYLGNTSAAGTATWSFAGLTAGQYRASATWTADPNRATNAPYTIRATGGGPALLATTINQELAPNDRTASGSAWEDLGVVTITGSTMLVELTNVGADQYVIADAIRIERIGAVPTAPEIAVTIGTEAVNDGGSLDFGDATVGTPIQKTFTIHNTGTSDLVLQPATLPSGFSIVGANFAVNQIVAAGGSTTLVVQLDAAIAGSYSGSLSFVTNDADENPFNVAITGDVFTAGNEPVLQIVDDGDAGFTTTGGWVNYPSGRGGDDLYLGAVGQPTWPGTTPTAAGVARWTFTALPAGQYRVSATWPGGSAAVRSTNAPFTVLDGVGGTVLASTTKNQLADPSDFTAQGSSWSDLGTVTITGGTIVVELTNQGAENYVVADAIRIERIVPPPGLTARGLTAGTITSTAGPSGTSGEQTVLSATPPTVPSREQAQTSGDVTVYSFLLTDVPAEALEEAGIVSA